MDDHPLPYCWWTKSCTTNHDDYPIIYRVLTIPGGAGFCPSTVASWKNMNHHKTPYITKCLSCQYAWIHIHHSESRWRNSQKMGHDKPIHGSCAIYFPGGIGESSNPGFSQPKNSRPRSKMPNTATALVDWWWFQRIMVIKHGYLIGILIVVI